MGDRTLDRKELEPTSDRIAKTPTLLAPPAPMSSILDFSRDSDVLQLAVSLAVTGTFASPALAFAGRPASALAVFGAPWAYAAWEWRRRVRDRTFALPSDVTARCQLLTASECAHCISIPVRHLRKELAPEKGGGGGNYAALGTTTLEAVIDAALPRVQKQTYTEGRGGEKRSAVVSAVTSEFGAERLVRVQSSLWSAPTSSNGATEERLWLGVAPKPPLWVGDEQCVHLCVGMPGGNKSSEFANGVVMPILAVVGADDLTA